MAKEGRETSMSISAEDPVLSVKGISKAFGGTKALVDVDFDIAPGERVAVMGENGAGKSTLMKVFAGVHQPDSGTMILSGQEYGPHSPMDAIRAGLSTVYQEPSGFAHLTVIENLFIGRQPVHGPFRTLDRGAMEQQARELLGRLSLPHTMLNRRMGQLSLAEQQQVLIVRAASTDARLLILDEPTSILTAGESDVLFELVDGLAAAGTAICYITHRFDELERTADRFVVLRDGKNAGELDHADRDRLLQMMGSLGADEVGKSAAKNRRSDTATAARAGEPVIAVRGLSSPGRYRDVSFDVDSGQIVGLYGLVGAGRTEVALSLFGELPTSSGTITYRGRPYIPRSGRDSIRRGIAYLPEDRKSQGVFGFMSVAENLIAADLGRVSTLGVISRRRQKSVVDHWAERMSIRSANTNARIPSLSGGNQQKALLARLMATEPSLLILDEPTRGIDVATKREIHQDIRALAEAGTAVLLISSELTELLELSEVVHVLHEGVIQDSLAGEEITESAVLRAAVGVAG